MLAGKVFQKYESEQASHFETGSESEEHQILQGFAGIAKIAKSSTLLGLEPDGESICFTRWFSGYFWRKLSLSNER